FETKDEQTVENGKITIKKVPTQRTIQLPLEASNVNVDLNLHHRQNGLLWYSTYKVAFRGVYTFRNTSSKDETVYFDLKFPTTQAIYDNLTFIVDGNPVELINQQSAATAFVKVPLGKTTQLTVGYNS